MNTLLSGFRVGVQNQGAEAVQRVLQVNWNTLYNNLVRHCWEA